MSSKSNRFMLFVICFSCTMLLMIISVSASEGTDNLVYQSAQSGDRASIESYSVLAGTPGTATERRLLNELQVGALRENLILINGSGIHAVAANVANREFTDTAHARTDPTHDAFVTLAASASRASESDAGWFTTPLQAAVVGICGVLTLFFLGFALYASCRIKATMRFCEEREDRFRDVAALSADWIWETDADLRFNFMSSRLEELTDLPLQYFIGHRRWEMEGDPGPDGWEPHITAMQRRECIEGFEFKAPDASGGYQTYRVKGKPLFNDQGKFVGYRGTGSDVTAEVSARKDANSASEMLKTSFENLGNGICVVDDEQKIVLFNSGFVELLELPKAMVSVGGSFRKLIDYTVARGYFDASEGVGDVERRLERACKGGSTLSECRTPSGALFEIRGQPLPSGGFLRTYRDVTAERHTQVGLEASERRNREVLDRALDAYICTDWNGQIIEWNLAAEQIFGWTRKEAIHSSLAGLIVPERCRSKHLEEHKRYQETGENYLVGRRSELTAIRKSGEEFPIELTVNTQEVGGERLFNGFIRDITERKESEHRLQVSKEEAEVASQAKSEFLAIMSHELRTPLNAIIGFSDVMVRELMGPLSDQYLGYATDIRASGDHLLALINDILDVSCVEANNSQIEAIELDLGELMRSCFSLLRSTAEASRVTLVDELPENLPKLDVDKRRVQQILLNLIGNAIKFSPAGSAIFVRVDDTEPGLVIEVVDQGPGIDPEKLELVFEPFVQLKSAMDRSYEGVGLGLTLAKKFAELHDGSIALESQLGRGTTAKLNFPEMRVVRQETQTFEKFPLRPTGA